MARRKVNLQFLNLPDTNVVKKVRELNYHGISFDSIHSVIWGGEAPIKDISWFDRDQESIHKAVFQKNIKNGTFRSFYKKYINLFD